MRSELWMMASMMSSGGEIGINSLIISSGVRDAMPLVLVRGLVIVGSVCLANMILLLNNAVSQTGLESSTL